MRVDFPCRLVAVPDLVGGRAVLFGGTLSDVTAPTRKIINETETTPKRSVHFHAMMGAIFMAGDWIKMRTDLDEDPAVIGISIDTQLDEDCVVGKLWKIWKWANQQTVDGNASSVTETWIDRYLRVTGFAKSMQKHGWLVITGTGISIPNFEKHNGESAKKRALTSKRVSKTRQITKKSSEAPECNAPSVTSALPREEKRREEKTREEKIREDKDIPPKPPRGVGVSPDVFSSAWNLLGKPFAAIDKMSIKRKSSLASRSKDDFWVANWERALLTMPSIPFLRGEGDRGWVADVEFFLRPDTVLKIIEGRYDSKEKPGLLQNLYESSQDFINGK